MLSIFGFSIATFVFIILLLKKGKKTSDKILATWMGYQSLHLCLHCLHLSEWAYQYPHLLGTTLAMPVMHSIFLYAYVRELVGKGIFVSPRCLLHLLPFAFLLLLLIPFYSLSGQEKIQVFQNQGEGFEWFAVVQMSVFLTSGLLYNLGGFLLIKKYRARFHSSLSRPDRQMLRWLASLIVGLSMIWLASILLANDEGIFFIVSLFVAFIGVYGFKEVPVYFIDIKSQLVLHANHERQAPNGQKGQGKPKYQKSGLGEVEAEAIFQKLKSRMETERLYEDNELSLLGVAAVLDVPPNHLSQAINSRTGGSFFNYINKYRVQAFIQKAGEPRYQSLTFLAIALECGFSSKSTFNKYFKQCTGSSPSAFFKENPPKKVYNRPK